jgi:hypothetical protein
MGVLIGRGWRTNTKPAPAGLASGLINYTDRERSHTSLIENHSHSPAIFARRTTIRFREEIHAIEIMQMRVICQESIRGTMGTNRKLYSSGYQLTS